MFRAGRILGVFSLVAGAAAFGSAFMLDISSGGHYTGSDAQGHQIWGYSSTSFTDGSVGIDRLLVYVSAVFDVTVGQQYQNTTVNSGTFTLRTWDPTSGGPLPTIQATVTGNCTIASTSWDSVHQLLVFSGSVQVTGGSGPYGGYSWLLGSGNGNAGTFSAGIDRPGLASSGSFNMTAETAAVPEPFTIALCAGALGLALRRRIRKA